MSTHAKAVSTENRVNALVGSVSTTNANVATITSQQGTFGGFSGVNQSQAMPGGLTITYDPSNSGNEGGSNSQTSGQIGGAAAHVHSMTHKHTESADLANKFNLLQASFSDLCARLNTMYNALRAAKIL